MHTNRRAFLGHGILLGGSFERGATNLDPDPAISERILRENGALFASMR